jgi:hypothetical protein
VSDVVQTLSEWLTLREPVDAQTRSRELVEAVLPRLGEPPIVVHDLGSGAGSMMRWLAPLLPGPQTWVLHDRNEGLLETALESEPPADAAAGPVSVVARLGELDRLGGDDLHGASLVTASALLDVLASEELHRVVSACLSAGVPALFSLSVTGRVQLHPRHPLDEALRVAFNAHQLRALQGRRLLGPHAVAVARGLFLQAGWHVRPADTPWVLDATASDLTAEWLQGWVDAAVEQNPALGAQTESYVELRTAQLLAGSLTAVMHHRDLLAWPR